MTTNLGQGFGRLSIALFVSEPTRSSDFSTLTLVEGDWISTFNKVTGSTQIERLEIDELEVPERTKIQK